MEESIIDHCTFWLPDAKRSIIAGESLAATIYDFPLTIAISGPLGAGKTTVLQGFLQALGIEEKVTSPTFALEQRYHVKCPISSQFSTLRQGFEGQAILNSQFEVIHLDLYRLTESQSRELLHSTHDHLGIRAIEWPERAGLEWLKQHCERLIEIELKEKNDGRTLEITFSDLPLPSRATIEAWRTEVALPTHIIRHCDAVADFSEHLAEILMERGIIVRPLALRRAAEVHDLFRFIDFRPGAEPTNYRSTALPSNEEESIWNTWKTRYHGLHHEAACAQFLTEHGYSALGRIVATHGLRVSPTTNSMIEQKILYCADKRLLIDQVVTLEYRFEDFRKRYGNSTPTAQREQWYEEVKAVERELFPNGLDF